MKIGSRNGALGLLVVGTALAAGLPLLNAQQSGSLRRVQDPADQRTEVDPWQAEDWRRDLSVSDLEQREKSFERLVQAARRDAAGRARLEEWTRDSDREFAWSARLALRELEHRGLFLGLDPDLFEGFHGFQTTVPQGAYSFSFPHAFDLDLFKDMQAQPGDVQSGKSSVSLSITPDGVNATVTTEENGVEEKQEYSAESLDALLEAHPELRDRIRVGSAFKIGGMRMLEPDAFKGLFTPGVPWQFDFGGGVGGHLGGGMALGPGQFRLELGKLRTDVLGVYVVPTAEAEPQVDANLPAGGMWIQKVEPGTIAAKLGLQRGQTLMQIDGRAIGSRDDISAAMRARAQDAALEVEIVEPDGSSRTLRWEPPQDKGDAGDAGGPALLRKV